MDETDRSSQIGRRASTLVLSAALLLAVPPSSACAEADCDSWFVASIGGVPVGRVHERVARADSLIETSLESHLSVGRLGEVVEISSSLLWTETADGDPRGCRVSSVMAEEAVVIELTVAGDRATLAKTSFGRTTSREIDVPEDLVFPAALTRLYAGTCVEPGDTCSYSIFDTDYERFGRALVRAVGRDTLYIMDRPRSLVRLDVALSLYPGVEVREWRDSEGALWREEIPSFGLVRERATEQVARDTGRDLDIVASSMIETNATIEEPEMVDEALYELYLDGSDASLLVPEDGRQAIEGRGEHGTLLRVRRTNPVAGTTVTRPIEDATMSDYLEGNSLMQIWYPRVLGAAARAIAGTGGDSWEIARNMERWVHDSVDRKGFGTAFASAREVADRRYGDCSEHAVLMAAMARAVGIPSKLVSGLTHADGSFAYHMWVEVWTGEAWYALDPTIGRGSVDATHIKLAETAAVDGNVAELSVSLMKVLNKLSVRVVEYRVAGETLRP